MRVCEPDVNTLSTTKSSTQLKYQPKSLFRSVFVLLIGGFKRSEVRSLFSGTGAVVTSRLVDISLRVPVSPCSRMLGTVNNI